VHPATEYWASGRGLGHITPPGTTWPEGGDFPAFLADLLTGEAVVELGCGTGRLAGCFPAARYVGVDVCPDAVIAAGARHPAHQFQVIAPGGRLPWGTCILAHTVLLHVADDDLPGIISTFATPRVMISEILGRKWRRDGEPPVFNREESDYVDVMTAARYRLDARHDWPYQHYRDTDLTVLDFRRVD